MLIINYGQQKSASTFLALLTKAACAAAGFPQDAVRKRLLTGELASRVKYWGDDLMPVPLLADRMAPGELLTLKTHAAYRTKFATLLNRPDIRILITYRNAGDAALSAYEAGERAREKNDTRKPFFSQITSHRQAIRIMAGVLERATIPWLKSGLGTPVSYDALTYDTPQVLDLLAGIVGLPVEALQQDAAIRNLLSGNERSYNFNKGVGGRYLELFDADDLAYLEERCGNFNRFCRGEIGIDDL